jgi:hypothetical protein
VLLKVPNLATSSANTLHGVAKAAS